jgi:hypothetical protein
MNDFEPLPGPDGIELANPDEQRVSGVDVPETPLEAREDVAASNAEQTMTRALAALKHRGERIVQTVEHAVTPRRVAIGVSVAVGVTALLLVASRRGRRRRPRSIAGAVAQSLLREAVGRAVLGAAATAGARIAEAAVPMLVAAISARQVKRPRRARKSRAAEVEGAE